MRFEFDTTQNGFSRMVMVAEDEDDVAAFEHFYGYRYCERVNVPLPPYTASAESMRERMYRDLKRSGW